MQTTITCLGHGGAFSPTDIGNTAFLVECGDKRILIDCGTTVPDTLKGFGVDPGSLDAAIITHLHADHVGGLERLLYHRHYISKAEPIALIMGAHTLRDWKDVVAACKNDLDRHASPVEPVWPGTFGRRGVEGELCQFFLPVGPHKVIEVMAFKVNHGGDIPDMNCYAFRLTLPDKSKLFFSGDRIWKHEGSDDVIASMLECDLAFHELEVSPNPSGAHTHYTDLSASAIGDDKMRKILWVHHGLSPYAGSPVDMGAAVRLTYRGSRWSLGDGKFERLNSIYYS